MTTIKTIAENASELGNEAKASIEELGRSAARRLDEARDETGDALHTAASTVRRTGHQSSAAIDTLATGTAARLDATASYLEDHDLKGVWADLRCFGRKHATATFVTAIAIGFLAGSTVSRLTRSRSMATEGKAL